MLKNQEKFQSVWYLVNTRSSCIDCCIVVFQKSLRAVSIYLDHSVSRNEDSLLVKLLIPAIANDSPLAIRDAHNPLIPIQLSNHPLLPHYPSVLRPVSLGIYGSSYTSFSTIPMSTAALVEQ